MAEQADHSESPDKLRGLVSERSGVAITATVKNIILENGYKHVTPDDFSKVSFEDLGELPEKVKSLDDQRAQQGVETLKTMFADRGVDDVDAAVQKFLDGAPAPEVLDQEAIARARAVGGAGGGSVQTRDLSHLANDGAGMILDHFQQKATKAK